MFSGAGGTVQVWKSEDNLWELVNGSRDQAQSWQKVPLPTEPCCQAHSSQEKGKQRLFRKRVCIEHSLKSPWQLLRCLAPCKFLLCLLHYGKNSKLLPEC